MSKGSGLLIAAFIAVFTFVSTIFAGGPAAAKSQDGLPGYSQVSKTKKLRLAKTKRERVASYKKKRVASVKKRRYAQAKKARYAGTKKYRYAKLRKPRSHARYQRRGKADRVRTVQARGNPAVVAAVKAHARAAGVPVGVALAIVRHESGFKPHVTGRAGEIGLMQIKCSTARGIGYRGSCRGLYNVSTNLRYGMRYLRMALNRGSVAYYNAGVGAKRLPHAARRYASAVYRKRRNV